MLWTRENKKRNHDRQDATHGLQDAEDWDRMRPYTEHTFRARTVVWGLSFVCPMR